MASATAAPNIIASTRTRASSIASWMPVGSTMSDGGSRIGPVKNAAVPTTRVVTMPLVSVVMDAS